MNSDSSSFLSGSGNGYELQMGRWSRRLARQFVGFAGLQGAVKVLDVGCGTGSLCFVLGNDPEMHAVHGIDLSPDYIAYATKNNEDSRLTFQVGDACSLPFPDTSFDHALSMLVQRYHRTDTRGRHQAPAHLIVPNDGQQAAMQDAELLAKCPSDNEQRFDQCSQVGQVLDELPDAGLELHRPNHADLETEVA
jgi:SAM-dependent methyltransferase